MASTYGHCDRWGETRTILRYEKMDLWRGDASKNKYGFTDYPNELQIDLSNTYGVLEVRSFANDNDVDNDQIDLAVEAVRKYLNSID